NGAAGALVVWLSTQRLEASLAASLGEAGVQGMLIDSAGHLFARSGAELAGLPLLADADAWGEIPNGDNEVRGTTDANGVRTLVASAPVPAAGWRVLVLQPEDIAFGPIGHQLQQELLALSFAAAVVALIAIFFGRRFSRSYEVELEAMGRV